MNIEQENEALRDRLAEAQADRDAALRREMALLAEVARLREALEKADDALIAVQPHLWDGPGPYLGVAAQVEQARECARAALAGGSEGSAP